MSLTCTAKHGGFRDKFKLVLGASGGPGGEILVMEASWLVDFGSMIVMQGIMASISRAVHCRRSRV